MTHVEHSLDAVALSRTMCVSTLGRNPTNVMPVVQTSHIVVVYIDICALTHVRNPSYVTREAKFAGSGSVKVHVQTHNWEKPGLKKIMIF